MGPLKEGLGEREVEEQGWGTWVAQSYLTLLSLVNLALTGAHSTDHQPPGMVAVSKG